MRITIALIIVIVLGGVGFLVYRSLTSSNTSGVSSVPVSLDIVSPDHLAEYRRIEAIEADLEIVNDPFFKSLVNPSGFGTPIPITVTPGRENPFISF